MTDSEREKFQDLCSRKAITGQKYCLKRYFLRLVLKARRELRAVTESERKRNPDFCCIETKGTTTKLY